MLAVFCCVAALAITGALHRIDKDLLGWWLCERQVKSGGLNGRPEKLPDVGFPLIFFVSQGYCLNNHFDPQLIIRLQHFRSATLGGSFLA